MTLASVFKTPAYFSRFQVKYRRRREGKTDYYQRRNLIRQSASKYQAKKYRFIVRRTNSRIICQIAYATIIGDKIIAAAESTELVDYGMPVGLTNYSAAYATGLLCARRALVKLGMADSIKGVENATGEEFHIENEDLDKKPFKAVLDVGLVRTTTGARVFGAMKGAVDGGINIPHSVKRFPGSSKEDDDNYDAEMHKNRIFGIHVADYMRKLQEEDNEKYQSLFSRYIKAGITADTMEQRIREVHQKIRENPEKKQKPKHNVKYTREGSYIIAQFENGQTKRIYRPKKLTSVQRKERVQKKLVKIAEAME